MTTTIWSIVITNTSAACIVRVDLLKQQHLSYVISKHRPTTTPRPEKSATIFLLALKVCVGNILRGKNGVHAFGYDSVENEPIWMKSRAL